MPYAHIVQPGDKVRLDKVDASHHDGLIQEDAKLIRDNLGKEMADLQDLMFAAGTHSLLIVLQGRDTSGKDGTIRAILNYANVQTSRVKAFKAPTPEELAHDFLWRVHAATPGKGEIAIFNRSHYEDVLAVRVHKLAPKSVWKERFEHIDAFEKLLLDSNTIVVKFFLHISKDEQKQRLLDRETAADKSWKLNVGDWKERELWDDYTKAYEDVLEKCSTKRAPWRIVPANHKWFRDLAVFEAIIDELKPFHKDWKESLVERGAREKALLDEYRATHAEN